MKKMNSVEVCVVAGRATL